MSGFIAAQRFTHAAGQPFVPNDLRRGISRVRGGRGWSVLLMVRHIQGERGGGGKYIIWSEPLRVGELCKADVCTRWPRQTRAGMVGLDPKRVRLAPIWDKSGAFFRSDFSAFGAPRQMHWNLIWKSHRFVPFGTNLTHLGANLTHFGGQIWHPRLQLIGLGHKLPDTRGKQ